jgi:hypothetical protein
MRTRFPGSQKNRWSSENDEINLSSQSDAIIAHIDKRMDHLKQFFTIQLDQMRKQLGKLEQLVWEHFTAERRQVGKVEQLVREQFATFCNAPTLLNERRKWKSPITTKRYYPILDIIRDYKSCNGNSIYKILIKHTKAENQTYILN